MAVTLRPWLHDQIHSQLVLGHNWLEGKNNTKPASGKLSAHVDRKYEGLYHDNGSCVDIVGPLPLSPIHTTVLVLEVS